MVRMACNMVDDFAWTKHYSTFVILFLTLLSTDVFIFVLKFINLSELSLEIHRKRLRF